MRNIILNLPTLGYLTPPPAEGLKTQAWFFDGREVEV